MKYALIVLAVLVAACSAPTAPEPTEKPSLDEAPGGCPAGKSDFLVAYRSDGTPIYECR